MLEVLVLKNAVECTSQRLKWTSGGQVMTIVHAQLGSEAFPKLTFEGCLERKQDFAEFWRPPPVSLVANLSHGGEP